MQSFDSVALHLELAILLSMRNQLFSEEFSLNLQDLDFHQVMGITLQKQVIY